MLVPLLEICSRMPSSGLHLDALLPVHGEVGYQVTDWFRITLTAVQSGGDYRTENPDDRSDERARYWSTSFGPKAFIRMPGPDCALVLRFGREFRRRIDYRSALGEWTRDRPDASWLGQISVRYGLGESLRPLTPTGMR